MIFGPYWWIAIPGLILGIYAQIKMSSSYKRYSEVPIQNGMSGADAAREILDRAGLTNIPVEMTPGHLTDHYDPQRKALFLSQENYTGRSVAAVGVAAHEAGHALQQQAAYALFNFRMWLVPATQFANFAYIGLFLLGGFLGATKFITLGIVIFSILALFQLVTLPVEYDASRRAKQKLQELGLVQPSESPAVSKMLHAAALTYVAAMLTAVLQLVQFLMMFNRNDRD